MYNPHLADYVPTHLKQNFKTAADFCEWLSMQDCKRADALRRRIYTLVRRGSVTTRDELFDLFIDCELSSAHDDPFVPFTEWVVLDFSILFDHLEPILDAPIVAQADRALRFYHEGY